MKNALLIAALITTTVSSAAYAQAVVRPDVPTIITPMTEKTPKGTYEGPSIGEMKIYTTKYEDTFVQIARDHNIGFVELRAANPDVDPWLPGADVKMTIPTFYLLPDAPRTAVVINLPEMRLYNFKPDGKPPKTYPIGIGREGLQTPRGQTHVRAKKEDPTWRPTARMRQEDPKLPAAVPPGVDNPMGNRVLYLGWPEYAIHGTNKPYGIGRRSSSGCIRMYPEDIVKIYPAVSVGATVTVVNQPVKAAWIGNDFYIEAHPTMEQANRMEIDGGLPTYDMSEEEMQHIMKMVGESAANLDWKLIRTSIRERRGYPIKVATRAESAQVKAEEKTDSPS